MTTATLISAPAPEPVSLAMAKLQCRVEHSDEDALIGSIIVAMREQAETALGRPLGLQTWRVEADGQQHQLADACDPGRHRGIHRWRIGRRQQGAGGRRVRPGVAIRIRVADAHDGERSGRRDHRHPVHGRAASDHPGRIGARKRHRPRPRFVATGPKHQGPPHPGGLFVSARKEPQMALKTGSAVRLIQPEIRGEVIERRISNDDELELLVEWQEDGQAVRRWIDADRVEEVAA